MQNKDVQLILNESDRFVHQKNCTECGALNYVFNPASRYISCRNCHCTFDSSFKRVLTPQGQKPERFRPRRFLRIGQKILLEGKSYYVTGRACYRSEFEEYENGAYHRYSWRFDDWICRCTDGSMTYISEDKNGFRISYPLDISLKVDFPPNERRINFYPDKQSQQIREIGANEVLFFEGESSVPYAVGHRFDFLMYRDTDGFDYVYTQGFDWEEFFLEKEISEQELYSSLERNSFIVKHERSLALQKKQMSLAVGVAFISLLLLLLWIVLG